MKNMFKAGLMVALTVISTAASSQAGVLNFGGTTLGTAPAPFTSQAWSLVLTYTANNGGPTAAITAATLTIGAETFLLKTVGASNAPVLTVNALAGNDSFGIVAEFQGSTPGGYGSTFSLLSPFTVYGTDDIGAAIASDANVQTLGAKIGNTFAGQFLAVPTGQPIQLSGIVPAPEPGSIALLSGLGLIVGRRMLKRRAAKQNVAV